MAQSLQQVHSTSGAAVSLGAQSDTNVVRPVSLRRAQTCAGMAPVSILSWNLANAIERQRKRGRGRDGKIVSMCVCVCVGVRVPTTALARPRYHSSGSSGRLTEIDESSNFRRNRFIEHVDVDLQLFCIGNG